MHALLPLFEEKLIWPACANSWKEFATGTVEDLQDKSATQIEVNGYTGLRAYVKASLWTCWHIGSEASSISWNLMLS
jgi:hypothetical protein